MAIFLTKTYARIVNPSLAELDPALPPEIGARSPLERAWRDFKRPGGPDRRRRARFVNAFEL